MTNTEIDLRRALDCAVEQRIEAEAALESERAQVREQLAAIEAECKAGLGNIKCLEAENARLRAELAKVLQTKPSPELRLAVEAALGPSA